MQGVYNATLVIDQTGRIGVMVTVRVKKLNFLFLVTVLAAWPGFAAAAPGEPCVPIPWSVGNIDPAFGINREQFRGAILSAIEQWREATGVSFFREQRVGGMVINLTNNGTQAIVAAREKEESRLAVLAQAADARGKKLQREIAVFNSQMQRLVEEVADQNRHIAAARESRSSLMVRQLNQRSEDLRRQIADSNRRGAELEAERGELGVAIEKYREDLRRSMGSDEDGRFRVGQYTFDGSRAAIDIFAFRSLFELQVTLTHELGHARGLMHNSDTHSIMHPSYRAETLLKGDVGITLSDLEALRGQCDYERESGRF